MSINFAKEVEEMINKWKALATALAACAASLWFAVTWADDKVRKIEKIPSIERTVGELQVAQREMSRREDERTQRLRQDNELILKQLALILERQRQQAN